MESNLKKVLKDRSVLTGDLLFFLICFVFLWLHLFVFPYYPIYYEADHSAGLNDAKRFVDGEFIYRDFFEFQFPGSATLYALLILVFGPKMWILNFAILGHGMIAAYLGVMISRLLGLEQWAAYFPSAIFLFFGFRWLGIDGEHRMFSPLFIYLAIVVLLPRRTAARVAIAGILCSLASFFTQPRGFLAVVAIAIFLLIERGFVNRRWSEAAKLIIILGLASAVSLAVILAPFIIVAGPERFFTDTILFLRTYAQDPEFNGLQTYFATFTKIQSSGFTFTLVTIFYSLLIPLIYLIALIWAVLRARRSNFDSVAGVFCICFIGLLQSVATSGPNVYRLYQVSLPALIALVWVAGQTGLLKPIVSKILVGALVVFGLGLGLRLQLEWELKPLDTVSGRIFFPSEVAAERYEWLQKNTQPGDEVYETYNSHVNFPLGIKNPSRISVLLNSGYSPPEHVQWVIEDLKRSRPRYIIWDGAWTSEMPALTEGERLKPFYEYMIANYRRVKIFSPYDGRQREMWERMGTTGLESVTDR